MVFRIVDCDNIRESFASTGTTITLGGAVPNSRPLSAVLSITETFYGVARKGAEVSIGIFTYNGAGANTVTQTTIFYSTNSNAAVSFSSGTGEIFLDAPSRLFDYLNLLEITVASATTCDIGAAQGSAIAISGTTTITSLGTTANKRRFVRFSGALILTQNATSLILPGAANITTVAGDTAVFVSDASGNWRCIHYQRASLVPIDGAGWTAYTPTVTSQAGSFTTVSAVGGFKQIGKTVHFFADITITTIGTAATRMKVTVPVTPINAVRSVGGGFNQTSKKAMGTFFFDSGTAVSVVQADGTTFPGTSGEVVSIHGTYEAA